MNTIANTLSTATKQLSTVSNTARLDSEILLAHTLDITRAQLLARSNTILTTEQQALFQQLLERRLNGEPIAYIVGSQEFWSLPFKVTPDTLIPRPETELLVELALQQWSANSVIRVADLGTGSGAVALALSHERPHWQIVATDNSTAALTIAQQNAANLNIQNVQFVLGNWCDALAAELFNLIISNPPYVSSNDPHLAQGAVCFEPRGALVGGADGLQDLRCIVQQAPKHLLSGGWLLLEHGFDQAAAVRTLLLAQGYTEVRSVYDLSRKERVSMGKRV